MHRTETAISAGAQTGTITTLVPTLFTIQEHIMDATIA
jgi:hypothetical protein